MPHADDEILFSMDRDAIIGAPSHHQVSNLGVVQFRHDYDPALLATIARKAAALKAALAEKRHLNLNFIRGAHRHIPEILELVHWPGRLERQNAARVFYGPASLGSHILLRTLGVVHI